MLNGVCITIKKENLKLYMYTLFHVFYSNFFRLIWSSFLSCLINFSDNCFPWSYGGPAVLCDEPESAEGRLRHVGRLAVHHLDGHDAQAPDVNLLPVVLPVYNLANKKFVKLYFRFTISKRHFRMCLKTISRRTRSRENHHLTQSYTYLRS